MTNTYNGSTCSYYNASTASKVRDFFGTRNDWDNLSINEKKEYDMVTFTDDVLLNNINPGFYFLGSVRELPKKANVGDLVIKDGGDIYAYAGSEWINIGDPGEEKEQEPVVKMLTPKLCTQCGAPLKNSRKCIYCDTEFY